MPSDPSAFVREAPRHVILPSSHYEEAERRRGVDLAAWRVCDVLWAGNEVAGVGEGRGRGGEGRGRDETRVRETGERRRGRDHG